MSQSAALNPGGGQPAGAAADPPPGSGLPARTAVLVWAGVAILVLLVLATAVAQVQPNVTLAAVTALLVTLAWRRYLLAWPTLLGVIVLVILFIPVRRYTLAGGLPFSLEPYRVLIAVVIAAWLAALLVDREVTFRRTGLELPALLIVLAIFGSLLFNIDRVSVLSDHVVKATTFFLSFFLVMMFVSSIVTRRRELDALLMLLVVGGVVVAISALFEWSSGTNMFNGLDRFVPLLDFHEAKIVSTAERGDHVRAFASAQHSIALGAALVIVMPMAVYLYRRTGQLLWMGAAAALTMGALATTSRTAAIMLATELVVFIWLKRKATVRMLPLLLPLIVCVQIVMPGTLGTFKAILFPEQGLIAEEQEEAGQPGSGRLADVGPSLQEWGRQPLLGQGFGTRLPSQDDGEVNAKILDDQWLASLLEIGAIGFLGLIWLFVRAIRRLARRAKSNDEPHGWLLASFAASITAFAVGMLTFDAFSFIQVTFLCFILLGLSAAAIRLGDEESAEATS